MWTMWNPVSHRQIKHNIAMTTTTTTKHLNIKWSGQCHKWMLYQENVGRRNSVMLTVSYFLIMVLYRKASHGARHFIKERALVLESLKTIVALSLIALRTTGFMWGVESLWKWYKELLDWSSASKPFYRYSPTMLSKSLAASQHDYYLHLVEISAESRNKGQRRLCQYTEKNLRCTRDNGRRE